mgnify:CR=1 FL=1
MPAGISQSAVNPAALMPPRSGQSPQRAQEPAAAADAQNAQAVLATGSEELVQAPVPDTGSQRADNQLESTPTGTGQSEQAAPGGAPPPPPQQLQVETDRGLGGNVDITA